jgi:hypothetical protein
MSYGAILVESWLEGAPEKGWTGSVKMNGEAQTRYHHLPLYVLRLFGIVCDPLADPQAPLHSAASCLPVYLDCRDLFTLAYGRSYSRRHTRHDVCTVSEITCCGTVAGGLAERYHVVLADLRGYGDSSPWGTRGAPHRRTCQRGGGDGRRGQRPRRQPRCRASLEIEVNAVSRSLSVLAYATVRCRPSVRPAACRSIMMDGVAGKAGSTRTPNSPTLGTNSRSNCNRFGASSASKLAMPVNLPSVLSAKLRMRTS